MKVLINGHDLTVTPKLRDYIERKVGRLDRYMPNISEVQVDVSEEKSNRDPEDEYSAQITLRHQRGTILRAEERTADIYVAVDNVLDKMYRQIERYKGRRKRRPDVKEVFDAYESAVDLSADELEPGVVLRRKSFEIFPMLEQEAIDQMELLGHDFYVFMHADSGEVNVMYRRKDGNYGLLQPILP